MQSKLSIFPFHINACKEKGATRRCVDGSWLCHDAPSSAALYREEKIVL
jgi:hypothetical protein